jgi:hypothetical protein
MGGSVVIVLNYTHNNLCYREMGFWHLYRHCISITKMAESSPHQKNLLRNFDGGRERLYRYYEILFRFELMNKKRAAFICKRRNPIPAKRYARGKNKLS